MPLTETQILQGLIAFFKPDPVLFGCVKQPEQSHFIVDDRSALPGLRESE